MQHLNKVLCGVLVLILCVPLFAQYSAGENQDVQMYTGTKSTTSRTVLAECFTGTWCQYCPAAEGALNRLANEMNRSQLAIIEWHYGDAYEPPDGSSSQRKDFYGVPGFPTTFFDGLNPYIGGSTNANDATVYNAYKTSINNRLAEPSPISISLSGYLAGSYGIINAQITVLDTLNASTNGTYVHFVLCEDKNKSVVSGGKTYWLRFDAEKNLGMDLLNVGVGQTLSLQKNFTIDASWDTARLWIAVFVQNHDRTYHEGLDTYYTAEVYQSAVLNISAQPVPENSSTGLILVSCIPAGIAVAWIRRKTH